MLQRMGIEVWRARDAEHAAAPADAFEGSASSLVAARDSGVSPLAMDWPELAACVAACTRCELHQGRTQTVFGVGDRQARVLVIGEAPGAEEDSAASPSSVAPASC